MANLTDTYTAASSNNILEMFSAPADGRTVTTLSGTYTMGTVTAAQGMSTSMVDATGSSITYTPPTGTKWLHYRYDFQYRAVENSGILGLRLLLDGTVVTRAATGMATNYSNQGHEEGNFPGFIDFVFDLTKSTSNIGLGQVAGWTSGKVIKVQAREYSSSYDCNLHNNKYEDGTTASGDEIHVKPIITIIAYS
jgi:hypothetical protein